MTVDLLEAADRLYGLPLPEFTPARDQLAKSLTGTPAAAQVKALRKPSVAAWVVNLLVRREPGQVDQILSVGTALREAQAALSGEDLRALTRQRRQLTAAVTTTARRHALEYGQKVTQAVADEVEATLTAAMIDETAASAVRSGLLVRSIATTGLGDLDTTAYVAVPDADFIPTPIGEPAPPEPPELHVVPDPDADEKKRLAAEKALADAEDELADARELLAEAEDEVESLRAKSLQVQAEIDELRRKLGELEDSQDEIDEDLTRAQDSLTAARLDASTAEKARDRAQAALAKLS